MGIKICVATLLFAGFVGNIHAKHRPAVLTEDEIQIIHTSFFAESHPDLRWRLSALDNIERGHLSFVMDELLRAAHFGDKPSQAMVAEAYWKGLYGQTADRPLAYAWMDLAAERGYQPLLVKRDIYWRRLSEKERQSALERGVEVYAQYGDDVALPRLEEKLRAARSKKTGSRLGSNATSVEAIAPGASKVVIDLRTVHPQVTGAKKIRLWEPKYWQLDRYIAWKEVSIDAAFSGYGRGEVEVQPLKPLAQGN